MKQAGCALVLMGGMRGDRTMGLVSVTG